MFGSEQYKKLLIYMNNDPVFEKFQEIYKKYKNQAEKENVNLFYLYYQEHGHGIEKVKNLRYDGDSLKSHIDISQNYNCKNGKKVVMLK